MWTYFVWWFGAGSDQYPVTCHVGSIYIIYHLNDLEAQLGRVTSNLNHFSFHNIRIIRMPFKTWLLDLTFENDRVTCFGNRIAMNCFSFRLGSGQYTQNTSKYPNHLSSQISTGWMHLEIKAALHCLLSFPECHFHMAVSWSLLSVFLHCASPLVIPSSPDTKPWPLHLQCCCSSNPGTSGWSFVARPRPEPGRRHMTWETEMKHTAHIIPQTCKNLTIVPFIIHKFRIHAERPTLPGQLTAWLNSGLTIYKFYLRNFLGQSLNLIFEDLAHVRSYSQLT